MSRLQYPREALRKFSNDKGGTSAEEENQLLDEIIDTLFFASLHTEEGQPPRLHIVYHSEGVEGVQKSRETEFYDRHTGAQPTWDVIPFEPKPFTAKELVKLTAAVNLERTAVVVGPHANRLHILGLARRIMDRDGGGLYVVSAPEPGCIVVSRAGSELFRYDKGRHIPATHTFNLWDALSNDGLIKSALERSCRALIASLPNDLFVGFPFLWIARITVRLLEYMAATGHGGIIAILPDTYERAALPVYQIPKPHSALLSESIRAAMAAEFELLTLKWQAAPVGSSDKRVVDAKEEEEIASAQMERDDARRSLDSIVESIGHLTAVDNALLLGSDLALLGAGYPIPTNGRATLAIQEATSLQGEIGSHFDLDQHGSRHRAAACFAHEYPGALAFIASQDGPLRCMLRPPEQDSVLVWNLRLPVI